MEVSLLAGVIREAFLPEKNKDSKHLQRVGSMEDQNHQPLIWLSPLVTAPYGRSCGRGGTCSVGSLACFEPRAETGSQHFVCQHSDPPRFSQQSSLLVNRYLTM